MSPFIQRVAFELIAVVVFIPRFLPSSELWASSRLPFSPPMHTWYVSIPTILQAATDRVFAQHRYGCLVVAASGSFACIPPLLGWLSANMRSTAGTGLAIALNVSFGAPGQIVGVWIYKSDEEKKGYPTGHWTNAALLLMVTAGCILLRLYYGWRNGRTNSGERFAY